MFVVARVYVYIIDHASCTDGERNMEGIRMGIAAFRVLLGRLEIRKRWSKKKDGSTGRMWYEYVHISGSGSETVGCRTLCIAP